MDTFAGVCIHLWEHEYIRGGMDTSVQQTGGHGRIRSTNGEHGGWIDRLSLPHMIGIPALHNHQHL